MGPPATATNSPTRSEKAQAVEAVSITTDPVGIIPGSASQSDDGANPDEQAAQTATQPPLSATRRTLDRMDKALDTWRTQLRILEDTGPIQWLKRCIKQTRDQRYLLCPHEWVRKKDSGMYAESWSECKLCGEVSRYITEQTREQRLLPEVEALLLAESGVTHAERSGVSAASRATQKALEALGHAPPQSRSQNAPRQAPQAPIIRSGRAPPRKRSRATLEQNPRHTATHVSASTQTEASGPLCRDETPDEDTSESAVEKVMDILAGTPHGNGCATFLPHKGPWSEDLQQWREDGPICRTCKNSQYPETCAILAARSTRTRSVAVYADQCQSCRGLYDGIPGLEEGFTQPEDIYSHPLPLSAIGWREESDIKPPLMEPGATWTRPTFINGRLRFPDGQAAENAANAALSGAAKAHAATAVAKDEIAAARWRTHPHMHAAAMAARAAIAAANMAGAQATDALLAPYNMNIACAAALTALRASRAATRAAESASDVAQRSPAAIQAQETRQFLTQGYIMHARHAETESKAGHAEVSTTHSPAPPSSPIATIRMARIVPTQQDRWFQHPNAGPARQLMVATVRGLLHHVHQAKVQVDQHSSRRRKCAIPLSVTRTLQWQGVTTHETPDGHTSPATPYPWADVEAILIERRLAYAAPSMHDYLKWTGGVALCPNPIHGGATPAHELVSHYVQVAYDNASIAYHYNELTRAGWTGRWGHEPSRVLEPVVATPPSPLGLPLDQGASPLPVPQCHYLRIDHMTGIPGRWPVLHGPSFPPEGLPINAKQLYGSLSQMPARAQASLKEGSVYRMAMVILRGLDHPAEWQPACPQLGCSRRAATCSHAICPGTGCRTRRTVEDGTYQPCLNILCPTKAAITTDGKHHRDIEVDDLLCEELLSSDSDSTPDHSMDLHIPLAEHCDADHGARIQATANELARLTPLTEIFKGEDTIYAHCRTGRRKREQEPSSGPPTKRARPTIRFGAQEDVMIGLLTITVNGARRTLPCLVDSGANLDVLSVQASTPADGPHHSTNVRTLSGESITLDTLRTMHVVGLNGETVPVTGYAENDHCPLDQNCALLGMPAIKKLRIDLNALAFHSGRGHPHITFLPPCKTDKQRPITVFEIFCGTGVVSHGLEKAGWQSVGMLDSDENCIRVCQSVFPKTPVYLNCATTMSLRATLKQIKPDVIWLSPPCQPASSLNRNKKPNDPRAAAAVAACGHSISARPALILIENVPAWSKTRPYGQIIRMMQNAAYIVSTHILDVAKCGIAQSRKRLIVAAFLGREPVGIATTLSRLQRGPDTVIKDVLPDVQHIYFPPRPSRKQAYVISADDTCPTITTKCMGRPGRAMRPCKANSAELKDATVLTIRDFAKLQGFPTTYPLPYSSPTLAARMIGNAFPAAAAQVLAKAVTPALHRHLRQPVLRHASITVPDNAVIPTCTTEWKEWCGTVDILMTRDRPRFPVKCRLSEKVLRSYLNKHGSNAAASILQVFSIKDLDINKDLNADTRARILKTCKTHNDVFLRNSQELPRPVLGEDMKPCIHKITFKKDHTPTRCRAPEYPLGSATRSILEAWCAQGLASGLLVKAENSLWASRVLTVSKYSTGEERSGVPDGIRIVADLVRANTQKINVVPIYGHVHLELARVAGHSWYATMDAAKGYHSFATDRASSDSTAVWLPHNGSCALYRHTRAVMGDTSAGTTMNSRYAEVLANHLDARSRRCVSQMADDFAIFCDSLDELLYVLDAVLTVFEKFHITVNPSKVKIGYKSLEYWGQEFSKLGVRPTARNLCPIRQLQVPRTLKQLQAVLGLYNFHSHYIKDYDRTGKKPRLITYSELIAPLQQLTRGQKQGTAKFKARWGDQQQRAFERVRDILLAGVFLHAPDYNRPLRMATDASDHGYGIALYQLKPTADGKDPTSTDGKIIVPNADKINVIKMWSKAWTDTQRRYPVFFRESLAWAMGVKKCRPFVLTSKFPLHTLTDHLPLTWVRNSSGKAAISQFLTSQIADVNWTIDYLPGHQNCLADAISRPPFLGVLKPTTVGLHMMVKALLNHLSPAARACKNPWCYAGKDTTRLTHQVQKWRSNTNPIKKYSHSANNIAELDYDLAIIVPIAETSTTICHNLLKRGKPMACLIPTSLLHRVPQNIDGSYDKLVTTRVAATGRLCFATGQYIWVIHDPSVPAVHRIFRALARPAVATTPPPASALSLGTSETWTQQPTTEDIREAKKHGLTILTQANGSHYVSDESDPSTRIVVPPDKRNALIDLTHEQSHHLGWAMNWAHLKPCYWWPKMQTDIKARVSACPLCKLAKSTRRAAHTHWRSVPDSQPRTNWSFDYKGMPQSSNGSREIAGAIDFATHKLLLIPLPNRSAKVSADAILEHICHREGTPLRFHSDCAAELRSRLMSHLWKLQGTKATQTLGHNATGNSLIERVWRFVNAALRCLTDNQYLDWHKYMPGMAAAWNSTPSRTLGGISPFEASCGLPFRTPSRALGDKQPSHPRVMNQSEITLLHKAAEAFRLLAKKNHEWHTRKTADLLNSNGRWKRTYKLGDLVKIYIPPTAREAERRGRKAKHCFWYRGPAKIVKILSPTTYTVQMCKDGRLYDRAIMNVSSWGTTAPEYVHLQSNANSPPQSAAPTVATAPASTNVYKNGDVIAIKDDATEDTYWLADVTRVKGNGLELAYYGTPTNNLKTARFRPIYVTKANELTFTNKQSTSRWRGHMSAHGLPGCVVARNLKLTQRGELTTQSFQVVNTLVNTLSHATVDKPKK